MLSTPPKARKRKKQPLRFAATCASGLEELVEDEIEKFGGTAITRRQGAITWTGSLETGYRACLWSRFASRILLELARFEVSDPDALYTHAATVRWDDHFTAKSTFAVHTTLVSAAISHSQYATLRVKDAVVDQFRRQTGRRPDVNISNPDIRLNLHVQGTDASLSLDLSGESLHRRGYRTGGGEAPLKETLAAAIVHFSGWLQRTSDEPILLDPMCGSGTLLIEAALMISNSAPGLLRKTFGFSRWNKHDHLLWERLVQEALDQENRSIPKVWPQLIGYDADPKAVAAARKNAVAAGLRDVIVIQHRQLARLHSPGPHGCLLTNPPYGERLADKEAVKYLYRCLGRIYHTGFSGWTIGFFTANPDLAEMLGVQWADRRRLYNGPIRCQLLTGKESKLTEKQEPGWTLTQPAPGTGGEDFAHRLIKNWSALLPWTQREDISCFRLYDADMPEYNLAVDIYEGWIHVQEYAAPSSVDMQKAKQRFNLALDVIRSLFSLPRGRLFIKTRKKQKGTQQYQKTSDTGALYEVREGGARFLVNFTDYLDTGLFLDHRLTRARLKKLAQGKTFLNLFGYTGTATVYAAMGGAVSTTTVDISDTYLSRARANLALNGYGGPLHQTVQADCLDWLKTASERFGVIFVDPPTFSNSRHRRQVFDIQKDHATLLRLAMRRLSKGGVLIFSANSRKFTLDTTLNDEFAVREISAETIPPDFQRNRRIHRCWEFQQDHQL